MGLAREPPLFCQERLLHSADLPLAPISHDGGDVLGAYAREVVSKGASIYQGVPPGRVVKLSYAQEVDSESRSLSYHVAVLDDAGPPVEVVPRPTEKQHVANPCDSVVLQQGGVVAILDDDVVQIDRGVPRVAGPGEEHATLALAPITRQLTRVAPERVVPSNSTAVVAGPPSPMMVMFDTELELDIVSVVPASRRVLTRIVDSRHTPTTSYSNRQDDLLRVGAGPNDNGGERGWSSDGSVARGLYRKERKILPVYSSSPIVPENIIHPDSVARVYLGDARDTPTTTSNAYTGATTRSTAHQQPPPTLPPPPAL